MSDKLTVGSAVNLGSCTDRDKRNKMSEGIKARFERLEQMKQDRVNEIRNAALEEAAVLAMQHSSINRKAASKIAERIRALKR